MDIKTLLMYSCIIIVLYTILYLLVFSCYNIYKCNSFRCNFKADNESRQSIENICNRFNIKTPPSDYNVHQVVDSINNTLSKRNTTLTCKELDKNGYTFTKDIDPAPVCYYDDIPTVTCKGYKTNTPYKNSFIVPQTITLQDVIDNIKYIEDACPTTESDFDKQTDSFKNGCYTQAQLLHLNTHPYETNILPSFECQCTDKNGAQIDFQKCVTKL